MILLVYKSLDLPMINWSELIFHQIIRIIQDTFLITIAQNTKFLQIYQGESCSFTVKLQEACDLTIIYHSSPDF